MTIIQFSLGSFSFNWTYAYFNIAVACDGPSMFVVSKKQNKLTARYSDRETEPSVTLHKALIIP